MGIEGRVVLVTGVGAPLGGGFAAALRERGAEVVPVEVGAGGGRERWAGSVDEAVRVHGGLDALVHAALPPLALEPMATADVDDERWRAVWESAMTTTLGLLASVHPHLVARGGGRVVLVVPPVGLSGVVGLCPLATAAEGLRLLTKSTARQWGADRIAVNTVVAAPEHFGIDPAVTGTTSLAAPALGGAGDAKDDLGPVIEFLVGAESHFVTASTLVVDGGVWTAL